LAIDRILFDLVSRLFARWGFVDVDQVEFCSASFLGGGMAFDAGVLADLVDAKVAVAAAGVLVVGVVVAIKAVHWIELVLIQREANREYLDRY